MKRQTMSKYDEAYFAARALMTDTSVSLSETVDNLQALAEEIEMMLSTLDAGELKAQEIDEGEEIEKVYNSER